MASKIQSESVEEQMKKIVLVMNNGNKIQQDLETRQSCMEELQARMDERQSHLESKLDQMMDVITRGIENERGDVNTSFTEEENSIPLGIVLDNHTAAQVPNSTVDTHLSNENRNGKCFIFCK